MKTFKSYLSGIRTGKIFPTTKPLPVKEGLEGIRGVQILLGGLLFFVLVSDIDGPIFSIKGFSVLLAPLLTAIIVGNACTARPWLGRLHWQPARRHAVAALIASSLVLGIVMIENISANQQTRGDQFSTTLCAAQDLLKGNDPYKTGEPQCFSSLGLNLSQNATPLRTAPFSLLNPPSTDKMVTTEKTDIALRQSTGFPDFGYPPVSFLLIIPAAPFGFLGVGILVFILVMATMLIVGFRIGLLRAWYTATVCLGLTWFVMNLRMDPEILIYCALILAVTFLDRPVLSAVLLALSVCGNELTWFAVPFYIILTIGLPGRKKRFVALAASLIVIIGGWMVFDPNFIHEQLSFISTPMYPLGLGVLLFLPAIRLGPSFFTAACSLAFAALAAVAWRRPSWRWTALAICWAALWLYWRILPYYYLPMLWLAPVVAFAGEKFYRGTNAEKLAERGTGLPEGIELKETT